MSKITNDGLTRPGTGCFMYPYGSTSCLRLPLNLWLLRWHHITTTTKWWCDVIIRATERRRPKNGDRFLPSNRFTSSTKSTYSRLEREACLTIRTYCNNSEFAIISTAVCSVIVVAIDFAVRQAVTIRPTYWFVTIGTVGKNSLHIKEPLCSLR